MTARTAIVTGASAGFGRAVTDDLAAAGWRLVIDARTATELEAVAAELRATGADVTAVVGDIADPIHRRDLVGAAGDRIDLLVASAGTLGPSPLPRLAEVRLPDLDRTLRTNVVAQVGLIQEALPALRTAGGVVVAVTSDAAVEGYEGWGAYGASKAAFEQVAHVLAAEEPALAVYRLDPGDMRTRMHQDAFPGEDISDRPDPSVVAPAVRHLAEQRPPSDRIRAADVLDKAVIA